MARRPRPEAPLVSSHAGSRRARTAGRRGSSAPFRMVRVVPLQPAQGLHRADCRSGCRRGNPAHAVLVPRRSALSARFQFSIRSLLVLAVVVAVPCSWLATEMEQAKKQRDAEVEIEKLRGAVSYDRQIDPFNNWWSIPCTAPPGQAWLRKLLGDHLFVNVTHVYLGGTVAGDAGLQHLEGLTHSTSLCYGTPRSAAPGCNTSKDWPNSVVEPRGYDYQRRRTPTPQGINPASGARPRRHQSG